MCVLTCVTLCATVCICYHLIQCYWYGVCDIGLVCNSELLCVAVTNEGVGGWVKKLRGSEIIRNIHLRRNCNLASKHVRLFNQIC